MTCLCVYFLQIIWNENKQFQLSLNICSPYLKMYHECKISCIQITCTKKYQLNTELYATRVLQSLDCCTWRFLISVSIVHTIQFILWSHSEISSTAPLLLIHSALAPTYQCVASSVFYCEFNEMKRGRELLYISIVGSGKCTTRKLGRRNRFIFILVYSLPRLLKRKT